MRMWLIVIAAIIGFGAADDSQGSVIKSGDVTGVNGPTLHVGANSDDKLIINGGDTVSVGTSVIGDSDPFVIVVGPGSGVGSGSVIITGNGSTLTNNNYLYVGYVGDGALTIADGGAVSNNNDGVVGGSLVGLFFDYSYFSGHGTATVTGGGSTWTIGGDVYVGSGGDGELTIADGGRVTADNSYIGWHHDGTATVTGSGSTWVSHERLQIGVAGQGTLTIADGGAVSADEVIMGKYNLGTGTATVTGHGSTWSISGNLTVGQEGEGTLTIADGGAVIADNSYVGGSNLYGLSLGTGTVTVTGNGSTWTSRDNLFVDYLGEGKLTIADGGMVIAHESYIGGKVTVTGSGSTLTSRSYLEVNSGSDAGLTIINGGKVNTDKGAIARVIFSEGTVTVSGHGSTWTNTHQLSIGDSGNGELTITDGGVVSVGGGEGPVYMAEETGSQGTLNIGAAVDAPAAAPGTLDAELVSFGDGNGEIVFNHTATDYEFSPGIIGDGQITVLAGTTTLGANHTGSAIVRGGTLAARGTLGTVTVTGGTLRSGGTRPLHVTGDMTIEPDGTMGVELHGDGSGDKIVTGGTATLAKGSTIAVKVAGESLVTDGQQWTILYSYNGVDDQGATVARPDLAGFEFTGIAASNAYRIKAQQTAIAPQLTGPTAKMIAEVMDRDTATDGAGSSLDGFAQAVGNMTVAQAQRALTATTPQAVGASQAMSLRTNQAFQGTLDNYFSGQRMGMPQLVNLTTQRVHPLGAQLVSAAKDPQLLALLMNASDAAQATRPAAQSDSRWGGFATAYLVEGDREQTRDALGARASTYAGQLGMDYQVSNDWLAGLSFIYARSHIDFAQGRGDADVDSYRIGPYVGYQHGPWFAHGSLTYALHDNDLARRVPTTGDEFTADYNAQDVAAYVKGGVDLTVGDWTLTPAFGAQYVHTWTDSYEESGGGGALSVDEAKFDSLRSTLGISVSRVFEAGGVKLMPQAGIGWAHEYLNDGEDLAARFVGGSSYFTVTTAGADRDSIFYAAGVMALLDERTALSIRYLGETSANEQIHALVASLHLTF